MRAAHAVLAALVAAATLVSVAAAGPAGTTQRVAIEMNIQPNQTFVFSPLQTGALKGDSGRVATIPELTGHPVMREGQSVTVYYPTWTLEGKRGTLTIRERNEWVDIGNDGNKDGVDDGVAIGTWKVVRGTGQYAGIAGGGRSGRAGLGWVWYAREEGFLTLPQCAAPSHQARTAVASETDLKRRGSCLIARRLDRRLVCLVAGRRQGS